MSSRCLHNMVNFGPLTAEIDAVVWGSPANFNGFRVSAALASFKLYGVEQRAPPIFGSAPSRWALAHILVMAALCNRGPLYFCPVISIYLLSIFFSSPNLSGHRLDFYHTSTHGVALVRI